MDNRDRDIRRPRRRTEEAAAPTGAIRQDQHPVSRLQRLIGNAQVSRMLAQRDAVDEEEAPVQRAPAEEEEELVQTKADPGAEGGPVSESTAGAIQGLRGSGSPLDTGVRERMEAAFDTSFADVRVHAGPDASALNRSLTSKAFTTGSDVFLGRDAKISDSRLLAHELTHVVQQRGISGAAGGGGMRAGAAGDAYEQEADATASRVLDAPTDTSELTGR